MTEAILNVQSRTKTGKQLSKKLRRDGKLPGIFYFHGEESVTLTIDKKDLLHLLSSEVGVINLKFADNNERQCVVREIQYDPVSSAPVHIDFLGIKHGEKVQLVVPLHLMGTPKGVKDGGGVLQQSMRDIEIECLPRNIPEYLNVEVSSLDMGESLHLGELSFDNVTILGDLERAVATVIAPRIVREEEGEVPEVIEEEEQAEPEVISKGSKEKEEGGQS